jgi:cytochrome c556
MRRLSSTVCGAVMAVSAMSPAAFAQDMRDEDVISYRQEVMKTMGSQAAAVGQILAGMVPNTMLASHFEVLLQSIRQAKTAFEPNVEGGNALPPIWEKWDDFKGKLDTAEAAAVKAIELAKADPAGPQIGEAAIAVLACKSCHDSYKKP